jgi:glycosyltransferase involved in cell wall biosynthesis
VIPRSAARRIRKTVVQLLPAAPLSRTKTQYARVRCEIDIMLETHKYQPILVVTETVQPAELLSNLKIRTFDDPRVKNYHVPNPTLAPLKTIVRRGKFGKIMFLLVNSALQLAYLCLMTVLLLQIVLEARATIIHAHNPPDLTGLSACFVSKITGVPFVFEVHDPSPESYCSEMGLSHKSMVYRLLKLTERIVVTNCAALITVNSLASKYFKTMGAQRTLPIYTGVGREIPSSENEVPSLRTRYNLKHKRVILYAGTLTLAEVGAPIGYDLTLPLTTLPKILRQIPDAALVYVGEGNGKEPLIRLARSIGVQRDVVFTGLVSRKEVFRWITAADVLLVPYVDTPNNRLTTPTKLYEYMAVGRPIVATRFPGIREIIQDGRNGLLYQAGSANDLSRCIISILSNNQLATRLASTAKRDFVTRYSYEPNWSKLIALYDDISSGGSVTRKERSD